MAHMGPAAVPVVGKIGSEVDTIFHDLSAREHTSNSSGPARSGPSEVRHQVVPTLHSPVLEDLALALDADGLAETVEVGVTVPLGSGAVEHGTMAAFDASVSLLDGLERGRVGEVDGLEVVEEGLLVLLDRSDGMVSARPRNQVPVSCQACITSMVTTRPVTSTRPPRSCTVRISLLFASTSTCPSGMSVPCSTAATIIRLSFPSASRRRGCLCRPWRATCV